MIRTLNIFADTGGLGPKLPADSVATMRGRPEYIVLTGCLHVPKPTRIPVDMLGTVFANAGDAGLARR